MKIVSLRRLVAAAGCALALLAFQSHTPARADAAPSASFAFGSVDLSKILAGYKKKANLDQQIQALSQKLDAQFKQQVSSDMLSAANQQTLTTLLSKPTLSDADKAQITMLQQQSTKDAAELAALQQKQNPSAEDTARMQALTQQRQTGQQALQDTADAYKAQVQTEQDRLSAQLSATVRTAVGDVAKEHKLMMVFDAQITVYSANDITDDVLARLNK
ncbi:MAG: OmpH family outer membrane protein [Armatimonadota bacterium]|nr:OmpH family outer membrane protein [Armatimonadota bacterium]